MCDKVGYAIKRANDNKHPTYSLDFKRSMIFSYFCFSDISSLRQPDAIRQVKLLSDMYISHRFDLLGSGWVQVKHGMKCRGLEGYRYDMGSSANTERNGKWLAGRINKANLKESQRIWSLIDENYTPIDWHLDFKSGYRWPETAWYCDVEYGHKLGVDVKVPWELARMQHLPQLAWAFALAKEGTEGFCPPKKYVREFRNQILDFIATNPPRYGVNWYCTMDVGIRVANWLVAYDLFRGFGASFDHEFESVLARSVSEHGKHCIENLEYTPVLRSNHYLSDIAGLLFVAAYLPPSLETNRWLVFAMQELVSEMGNEFHPDGSNFEASTSYHRLSTEIMLYCSVLCLLLPKERRNALKHYDCKTHKVVPILESPAKQKYDLDRPEIFPAWYWERLERAVEFTLDMTKSNGEIPQFGDNDSGRFMKIWPSCSILTVCEAVETYLNLDEYDELSANAPYPDENILDHSHILAVGSALFSRPDLSIDSPEKSFIESCLLGNYFQSFQTKTDAEISAVIYSAQKSDKNLDEWLDYLHKQHGVPVAYKYAAPEGDSLVKDLRLYSYLDFGLYIYKSSRLYLAIRCGSIGQNDNGGHAHNDQLGAELSIDGKDIIRDPGTYIYTPLPERRNQFRSTKAHFVPQRAGKEQTCILPGALELFSLQGKEMGECLYFSKKGFVGRHSELYRVVVVCDYNISVFNFGVEASCDGFDFYSNGYGKWAKEKKY